MAEQKYVSDTLKKKKKTVRRVKTYLFVVLFAILIVAIILVLRIQSIQIKTVNISGNAFVTTGEINAKANTVLDSNYLFVIPKRNIFLFPKGELVSKIKENPAIIDVQVNKDLFDTISIEVTEQNKEAIYCTTFERADCYFINKEGYLYSKTGDGVALDQEIIVYLEGEPKKLKDTILDSELYGNMIAFIKSTSRSGIAISSVYAKSDGVIEFNTTSGARLLVSKYDDLERDFSNFMALFEKEVLTIEQLAGIDYIDLRFGNKVFYKNRTY